MKIRSAGHMAKEFASTFREWHYLVGGLSVGFVAGWLAHVALHRAAYGDAD